MDWWKIAIGIALILLPFVLLFWFWPHDRNQGRQHGGGFRGYMRIKGGGR
ncbi:MAG: hypothetical protein HYS13_22450 [Planctomycetia bacterium]|nr:hypothetical protein [Planctomycetia bacterium]